MNTIEQNAKKLYDYYSACPTAKLIFVTGEKGLGKSYTVNQFLRQAGAEQVLHIGRGMFPSASLGQVERQTAQYLSENYSTDSSLDYNEQLMEQIIWICTQKRTILYFEDVLLYAETLYEFSLCCIQALLNQAERLSAFIIVELDLDETQVGRERRNAFYALSPAAAMVPFKRFEHQELSAYLLKVLGNKVNIMPERLHYIIDSALGNLSLLNIIINYLKQEGLLCQDTAGYWLCQPLKAGILHQVLTLYIQRRYDKLDPALKMLVKRSSLLGIAFSSSTIASVFHLLQADEHLRRIEQATHLIYEQEQVPKNDEDFRFENEEVLYFAVNAISEEERAEWNRLLALYFIEQYQQHVNSYHTGRDWEQKRQEYVLKSAHYSEQCGLYNQAFQYYIAAIQNQINSMNYADALTLIAQAKKMSALAGGEQIRLLYNLDCQQADCYRFIGDYSQAKISYGRCLSYRGKISDLNVNFIQYYLAYCTYYSSYVDSALYMAEQLEKALSESGECDSRLYIWTLILLATIYREIGSLEKTQALFAEAVKRSKALKLHTDYHILLRRSNMCLPSANCIPSLIKSVAYFEQEKNKKEYAKAQLNLAIEYLFIGQTESALRHNALAMEAFERFGSIDVLYCYNLLGTYYAVHTQEIGEAYKCFAKANIPGLNAYKSLCIQSNQAICAILLGNLQDAEKKIMQCRNMEAIKRNERAAFYHFTMHLLESFYAEATKSYKNALEHLVKALPHCLTENQRYFTHNKMGSLAQKYQLKLKNEPYSGTAAPIFDQYLRLGVHFSSLKFI